MSFNVSRRHVLALKITFGITVLGLCGINIAMSYPNNEILIGASLLICGGAGMACMPLTNELIVETTFPAGEATSTGIGNWLAGPLSGLIVALSSLVPYGDIEEYPHSVCRDGELQNLSCFFFNYEWYFPCMLPFLCLFL